MRRQTCCQLKRTVILYFKILPVFLCMTFGNILWADSKNNEQMGEDDKKTATMYQDLKLRINDPNVDLSQRVALKINIVNKKIHLISLSESINSGYGVIGIYDENLKIKEMIKISKILSIQTHIINKDLVILAVKTVHGAGTGYWSETLSLYNPLDLHNCLWSDIINEYCIGPVKDKCSAYQLRALLRFLDIDCDGKEEILIMKTKCWIPKEAFSISDPPELTSEAYKYNEIEKKFSRIETLGQMLTEQ
jgi:hypothetical protein